MILSVWARDSAGLSSRVNSSLTLAGQAYRIVALASPFQPCRKSFPSQLSVG